jgi:hypothetical protein
MTNQHTGETASAAAPQRNDEALSSSLDVLEAWLGKPGTTRSVVHMGRTHAGRWLVRLSAGGFVHESITQETLAGAIRSAVQAAAEI